MQKPRILAAATSAIFLSSTLSACKPAGSKLAAIPGGPEGEDSGCDQRSEAEIAVEWLRDLPEADPAFGEVLGRLTELAQKSPDMEPELSYGNELALPLEPSEPDAMGAPPPGPGPDGNEPPEGMQA